MSHGHPSIFYYWKVSLWVSQSRKAWHLTLALSVAKPWPPLREFTEAKNIPDASQPWFQGSLCPQISNQSFEGFLRRIMALPLIKITNIASILNQSHPAPESLTASSSRTGNRTTRLLRSRSFSKAVSTSCSTHWLLTERSERISNNLLWRRMASSLSSVWKMNDPLKSTPVRAYD